MTYQVTKPREGQALGQVLAWERHQPYRKPETRVMDKADEFEVDIVQHISL